MSREGKRSCVKQRLPEEFWQHRRAARHEELVAYRSILDSAIERLDPEQKQRGGSLLICFPWTLLSDEFWAHKRAARRERLLSYRSLLDALVEQLEEKTPAQAAGAQTT